MSTLVNEYLNSMKDLCDALDREKLDAMFAAVRQAWQNGKTIFVAGNGGSAATANHFFCDFSKNAVKGDVNRAKVITLSSDAARITALGNDYSFDRIFSEQLINLMDDGDAVILISASGNSPDVIKAAEYAKSRCGVVIGLTGFSGGRLCELSDINIHCPATSYEQVEDVHSMVMHMLVCYFKSLS